MGLAIVTRNSKAAAEHLAVQRRSILYNMLMILAKHAVISSRRIKNCIFFGSGGVDNGKQKCIILGDTVLQSVSLKCLVKRTT